MDEEKSMMEALIAKLDAEKEELAAKMDGADVELDDHQSAKIRLEQELEEAQLRLQVGEIDGAVCSVCILVFVLYCIVYSFMSANTVWQYSIVAGDQYMRECV